MRDVYAASFNLGRPESPASKDDFAGAARTTLGWVARKYGLGAPSNWEEGEISNLADRAVWRQDVLRDGEAQLWQLDWHQKDAAAGTDWVTRCQVGRERSETRFTVRIAIDSDDIRLAPTRYELGRPNVIPRLAQAPGIYMDGKVLRPLPSQASSGAIAGLVELLLDPSRRLPVIVLTPTGASGRGLVDPRDAAFRLIGLAHVVEIVEREATFLLTDRLGQLHSVFGGAIRTYWPNFALGSNPLDHPLWLPARIEMIERSDLGVVKRLERQLAGVAVGRVRADPLESQVRAAADAAVLGRVSLLQAELQRLLTTGTEPGAEWLAELQDAYDTSKALAEQVTTLQRENEGLRRETEQVRRSFADFAQAGDHEEREPEPPPVPESVRSCSQAFEYAQRYLKNVVLPQSAAVALDELDAANEAQGWSKSAWRGLRALDAYASEADEFEGFWDWCTNAPRALWTASPKKLAMAESDTVMQSRDLREKRRFDVDSRVDPSGTVLMEAHLKVAEGGGPQIPRIYFYDDTAGTTGKVHVGFFGPHRYVPNKSTN